jgi:hypothetical protein
MATMARGAAAKAHFVELLRDGETGHAALHHEGGYAPGALGLVGLGIDQKNVGDRAVGNEELAAVEHVMVAFAAGGRAHRAECIGAGAGLGQSQRADGAAVAQPGQEAHADVIGAVASDVVKTQILVGDIAERDRRVPARQALRDQPRGEEVAAGAAELGGGGDAQKAHAGQRRHRLRRPPFLVVHTLLQRPEFGLREAVAGGKDFFLLLAQAKAASRK